MKRIILLFVVLLVCGLSFGQSHTIMDSRTIDNWNSNWGKAYMDTLHAKPGAVDTLLLTGLRSGFHGIVQPLSGDVYIQLSGVWSKWWTVFDGLPFSWSGGQRDTLFVKSAEADSSVVQVMWTAWE